MVTIFAKGVPAENVSVDYGEQIVSFVIYPFDISFVLLLTDGSYSFFSLVYFS